MFFYICFFCSSIFVTNVQTTVFFRPFLYYFFSQLFRQKMIVLSGQCSRNSLLSVGFFIKILGSGATESILVTLLIILFTHCSSIFGSIIVHCIIYCCTILHFETKLHLNRQNHVYSYIFKKIMRSWIVKCN
jgi:hypothetical protein